MRKTKKNQMHPPAGLDAEITDLLYGSHKRALLASIIVAISLVSVQFKLIDFTKVIIWIIIFVVAYGLRTILTTRYNNSLIDETSTTQWLKRFRTYSGFCGLAWGMAGVLLFPPNDIPHQAFLIFALVGVAGGAVIVYSIDIFCSNIFLSGLLIPTTIQLLISGSHFTIVIALLFTVYAIYISVAGRVLAKSLRENIVLRIAAGHDHERVHKLAYYDVLTGLPNRRMLSDYLSQTFLNCEKLKTYGAALFLDLDDFKNINDLRGHTAGDELLKQVALRLQNNLDENQFVARVGGDEFILVVNNLGEDKFNAYESSKVVADKLIQVITNPFFIDGYSYHSSPSIGICVFLGGEFDEIEVLRRADIAMYQAKRLGRKSTLQFYDDDQNPILQQRAAIESDLRLALQNQQLSLYYQVQVDENKHAIGAEVLLRWNHPALGWVPPADFIPIAEESGEILSIGDWVLTQACKQLKAWEGSTTCCNLKLSVNVSALQFNQPNFVEKVIDIISESGCSPKLLKIELTESLILQNIEDIIHKMELLKIAGISFSLDDFGTGHSSLSVLKRLPINELKIDQSFVGDIVGDSDNKFIAQTIITMGKTLGLTVIAEGVETEEQKELLLKCGCHVFQGYLFSKPVPIESFTHLFNDGH